MQKKITVYVIIRLLLSVLIVTNTQVNQSINQTLRSESNYAENTEINNLDSNFPIIEDIYIETFLVSISYKWIAILNKSSLVSRLNCADQIYYYFSDSSPPVYNI